MFNHFFNQNTIYDLILLSLEAKTICLMSLKIAIFYKIIYIASGFSNITDIIPKKFGRRRGFDLTYN